MLEQRKQGNKETEQVFLVVIADELKSPQSAGMRGSYIYSLDSPKSLVLR